MLRENRTNFAELCPRLKKNAEVNGIIRHMHTSLGSIEKVQKHHLYLATFVFPILRSFPPNCGMADIAVGQRGMN